MSLVHREFNFLKISIVTPSFQQGRYLESCMRSILDQGYPALEYLVMDGGSTDGSVEIIRRYADRLTFWRSHPDGGQMDGVADGLLRSTGAIMGWLNSDDMLAPWTLRAVADIFESFPQVEWLTSRYPILMDEDGIVVGTRGCEGFNARAFFRGRNVPLDRRFYNCVIQQESTFWRRSLWERAGARVDTSFHGAGDFELWSRFFLHAQLYAIDIPLALFRFQLESFTSQKMESYLEECRRVLRGVNDRPPSAMECGLRRVLRVLPPRLRRFIGAAYPAPIITHTGRGGDWRMDTTWFI